MTVRTTEYLYSGNGTEFIEFANLENTPINLTESSFSEDFNLFTGSGFSPNPSPGQLNSQVWIVEGFDEGDLDFGGTGTSGDFARGTSTGGVTTGGVYGFEVASSDKILGVQPTGNDFTPGNIILRLQNTNEETITEVPLNYEIWYLNDQNRANYLNFSYSEDGVTFTPVTSVNFTTPQSADTLGWQSESRTTTITGVDIAPDDFFFLQWTGDDVSGSGSRDEYGIDDVQITGLAAPVVDTTPTFTNIHTIQGDGLTSPIQGATVIIEGIVVGDFQGSNGLRGFYVQEEDADADDNLATSEGIFVFESNFSAVDVQEGDLVRVTGTVAEFLSSGAFLTQLSNITEVTVISNDNSLPTSVIISDLKAENASDLGLEPYEGMGITFSETLSLTEYFQLGRFGEVVLSVDGRLQQPTNVTTPGDAANALAAENELRRIVLDDGSGQSFRDPILFGRNGQPLSSTNLLRGGDTVEELTGVLDQRIGTYRVQTNEGVNFQAVNERPTTVPDVGGSLTVAAYNVLNYFVTLADGSAGNRSRGANTENEFQRQQDKLVSALSAINADIFGFMELENDADITLDNLVDALNAVAPETYDYVATGIIGTDAIKVGLIYKVDVVKVVGDYAILNSSVDPTFQDNLNRPVLAQTFEEIATGEKVTVAVNHLKSKGQSGLTNTSDPNFDQGDGQGFWNATRTQAANALVNWLETDPTDSGDSDFLIIGDLNAYTFEDPITTIQEAGYTDLIQEFVGPDAYSFVFSGLAGALDHALSSPNLTSQVTGAAEWHINADEPNVFDYNDDITDPGEFAGNPPLNPADLYEPNPFRSSDHDALIVGLDLSTTPVEPFTLQILHASDQEAGVPALQDAIGLSAVMNALEPQYENTIKLSSGDIYISGPFFNASQDIYDRKSANAPNATAGQGGIADILIQNELGWDAAAVGNHEFGGGPETFYNLLAPNPNIVNGVDGGQGIDETQGYPGALFPYLATNLDYTGEPNLQSLVVPNGEAAKPNSLAGSVIVDVNGESIGVVGAVVPYLPQIANIGAIEMLTDSTADTFEEIAQTIADSVQPVVDDLVAQGINKIILMTHLQQFEGEQALAPKLRNVDVLMGGGSHRVMASEDDPLRQDETQTPPQVLQPYPQEFLDADGKPIYLINTAANYRYLSQLVVEFDENGEITRVDDSSGTFATDIAGVDRLYEEDITTFEQVREVADPELVEIVDGVGGFINKLDRQIYGNTAVYLNGLRGSVRSEETNLGNLSSDANLWYSEKYGFDIDISVRNGGGIRDQIGVSYIEGGTNELIQLPPQANPEANKEEGDVSRLDISNSLRFDNSISVVDISAEGIKDLAEHFVARWAPGVTAGQFGQIGGFAFSFDPDNTAITFERDSNQVATGVATAGERIQNLAILNEDGTQEVLVEDGELQVNPTQTYKMAILSFLARGGDGYPVFHFQNEIPLSDLDPSTIPDNALDLAQGSEQDALAEFFAQFHPDESKAFNEADTPIAEDARIQNLDFRDDTVIDEVIEPPPKNVFGTSGDDSFDTEVPNEKRFIGDNQVLFVGSGNDTVDVTFAPGGNRIDLGSGDDILFGGTNNRIIAGSGDDMLFVGSGAGNNVITGGSGDDQFWIVTDEVDLPTITNTITDFTIGQDVIRFGNTSVDFDALTFTQSGSRAVINALGQDLAILLNTQASALSTSDFVFG